jgi:endonuclease YncB( thermonuclease family)
VIEVYDGDTLTLLVDENGSEKRYKVRFYGIDAPEADQEYGITSRDALREKILGEKVRVEVISVDRYGRSVGKVMLGGRYINLEMVSEGNAWYYADYASGERDLENAQNQARSRRQGLWYKNNPLPPWEYRSEKRN